MPTKYERFAEQNLDVRSRSGDELVILCPFHDDTNPSLYLNSKSGLWICHACGEAGSMEILRVRLWGLNGPPLEADILEDVYSVIKTLEAEEVLPAQQFYPESFLEYFDFPTPYWHDERKLSRKAIEKFGLGSDPFNDEVTIPIRDEGGNLLGVIRRKLGEVSSGFRYEYPKGVKVSDLLFGSWAVEGRVVYLTEGSIDAISLWDIGVEAMATGGSRMTKEQANVVRRLGITTLIVFPDNRAVDAAADELVKSVERRLDDVIIRVVDWTQVGGAEKDANDLSSALRAALSKKHIPIDEWLMKHDWA